MAKVILPSGTVEAPTKRYTKDKSTEIKIILFVLTLFAICFGLVMWKNEHGPIGKIPTVVLIVIPSLFTFAFLYIYAPFNNWLEQTIINRWHRKRVRIRKSYRITKVTHVPHINFNFEKPCFNVEIEFANQIDQEVLPQLSICTKPIKECEISGPKSIICNIYHFIDNETNNVYILSSTNNPFRFRHELADRIMKKREEFKVNDSQGAEIV